MTELMYQNDSYLQAFEARVDAVDAAARAVVLDRSAFYPGGGGQPCDLGTLTIEGFPFPVMRVQRRGTDVLHTLGGESPLPMAGAFAAGQLDWERRHALMRTHTALHILCGVVFRDYGALVTGGDMDPFKGRMDFEFETLSGELVHVIEAAVSREIEADRPIQIAILPRAQAFAIPDLIRTRINLLPEGISQVRTVEIAGLDLQADGGTHVRGTREVGRVRVTDYKSKGKFNKRLYIEVS
jgi:misacylated tRNA(Ala) deacylase